MLNGYLTGSCQTIFIPLVSVMLGTETTSNLGRRPPREGGISVLSTVPGPARTGGEIADAP